MKSTTDREKIGSSPQDKLSSRKLILWIAAPGFLALAVLLLLLWLWIPKDSAPAPGAPKPMPATAVDLPIEVMALSGRVQVERAGLNATFDINALSRFRTGDLVTTPAKTWLELKTKEGARLLLASGSSLRFEDEALRLEQGTLACVIPPQKTKIALKVHLAEGLIQSHEGRLVIEKSGDAAWRVDLVEGTLRLKADDRGHFISLEKRQAAQATKKESVWFLRKDAFQDRATNALRRLQAPELKPRPRDQKPKRDRSRR